MVAYDSQSLASRYMDAAGRAVGQRYHLATDELVWLINYSTDLSGLRLELLRELQSALPPSEEDEDRVVTELKELLTNLIIMQTRLADRDGRFSELLHHLIESGLQDGLAVDEASLRKGIQAIGEASEHIQAVAGQLGV